MHMLLGTQHMTYTVCYRSKSGSTTMAAVVERLANIRLDYRCDGEPVRIEAELREMGCHSVLLSSLVTVPLPTAAIKCDKDTRTLPLPVH